MVQQYVSEYGFRPIVHQVEVLDDNSLEHNWKYLTEGDNCSLSEIDYQWFDEDEVKEAQNDLYARHDA